MKHAHPIDNPVSVFGEAFVLREQTLGQVLDATVARFPDSAAIA
jgi:hypothetical protein